MAIIPLTESVVLIVAGGGIAALSYLLGRRNGRGEINK